MKSAKRPYVMTARAEKAAATRQRIIGCVNRLYSARPMGELTLEEVAVCAGTTVQTVLRVFGSKEALMVAALDVLAADGVPLRPTPSGDVAAAVGAIFDIYETIGDLVLRQLADEPRHPALAPALDRGRANHAEGVRRAFAAQLAQRAGTARTRLFHALTAITDVYVWKKLRRDAGLDRATAETIVCEIILGVTETEATDGRALPGDADAAAMREATEAALATPFYRLNAHLRSRAFAGHDGAAAAADELAALLPNGIARGGAA